MSKNYYEILEINENATPEEIKKAYRKLALQNHPDKGGSEARFKEISEAYTVLFNSALRKQYNETGSTSSGGSQGEIGASYDWRGEAWHSIREALAKNNVKAEDLGPEYLKLFGHQTCQGLSQLFKGDYFIHIVMCLESISEAENFKNGVLNVINNYASKLSQFKEEVIHRIEKYANENLSEGSKKTFNQESYDGSLGKSCDWREQLRFFCSNEKAMLEHEKILKRLVDTFKAIDKRTRQESKNYEERGRKYEEEYQNWQNKLKDSSSGKDYSDYEDSPTSDKITQLKLDIERLKRDLADPSLTEKEKVEVQEKLERFEKELATLETSSNSGSDQSSKDNNDNGKDQKISQLEKELEELKNNQNQTPEQQAENQKKIAQKEQELAQVKENNENHNQNNSQTDSEDYNNWTHDKLVKEIQKVKTELEQIKNNQGDDSSKKKAELIEKLKKLEKIQEKKSKDNKNPNQSNHDFPMGWIVGGGGYC